MATYRQSMQEHADDINTLEAELESGDEWAPEVDILNNMREMATSLAKMVHDVTSGQASLGDEYTE